MFGVCFWAPPHHYVVPSPYKQGESAVRAIVALRKVSCTLCSVSCTLYSVLCTLASFFRNNLRRILPHHRADVEGDDEEDDEGGKNDAEEDGHDGGDTFLVAEVLQELIEEDAYGDCNDACHTDEPQIEATEKQSNVPSFGAVNLA